MKHIAFSLSQFVNRVQKRAVEQIVIAARSITCGSGDSGSRFCSTASSKSPQRMIAQVQPYFLGTDVAARA